MWGLPDEDFEALAQHSCMRILLATNGSDADTLAALVRLLPRAEVALAHSGDPGQSLELALRNALPDQEVVTVPVQVVVDAEEPTRPRAILGLRSLRTLIGSGALVICAFDRRAPVVIGKTGKMEAIGTAVDPRRALELLARRLDARPLDLHDLSGELGYARPA